MQLTNDALFSVDSETGWVSGLRQLLSPNCDARPEGAQVEVIVLHGISLPAGQFGGDAVKRPANLTRSVGLGIPHVDVTRPTGQPKQNDILFALRLARLRRLRALL